MKNKEANQVRTLKKLSNIGENKNSQRMRGALKAKFNSNYIFIFSFTNFFFTYIFPLEPNTTLIYKQNLSFQFKI